MRKCGSFCKQMSEPAYAGNFKINVENWHSWNFYHKFPIIFYLHLEF